MSVYDDLVWRELVVQMSDPVEIPKLLSSEGQLVYAGFDPSASSLHIGHLVPLLALRRFQLAGHKPIALIGGATGLIGDPGGRTTERTLNIKEVVAGYVEGMKAQINRIIDPTGSSAVRIINNLDWFEPMSAIDFLRDVGKHFSVNTMIAKDSVQSRLNREDIGISYTEFSYMLLQAFDFLHLFKEYGCRLQMGATEQWGNMTAGIELVRRKLSERVYCLTSPLILNAAGVKFGKSEAGAVWLDAELTSPYALYQYFVNTDDRDVVNYLKYFTLLGQEEIRELEHRHQAQPDQREAQRRLAYEVTAIVHGPTEADKVVAASQALFGNHDLADIDLKTLLSAVETAPTVMYSSVDAVPSLMTLAVEAKLVSSKSEARRQIESGGIYVNNSRISDIDFKPTASDLLHGKLILLRKGKRNYSVVRLGG